ncbi:hypothetical protein [Geodermatophilus sp. URMC 62]|uniref:hypothetical protein n=1 Tax=Geodermatophilus sp. URMC 62 TaxID=3423414 RepID=UPI00406C356C
MTHFLDESCLAELLAALSGRHHLPAGSSDLTLAEGFIEVRCRSLEGRAVCAAMTVDGVLWVVIDPDKPNAVELACEMLEEWRARYLQSTVTEAYPR